MLEVVLSLLAGLVLFLFAVNNLSSTITDFAGDNVRLWILKFTKNLFSGIITGTIFTTLLDSSSAVIIIAIVLINAKLLTFKQTMGIIMGANIGTTFSSQLIAMNIGKFSPVLLVLGFILLLVAKSNKLNNLGKIVVYFGMLFFGLYTMERAVEPLRNEAYFQHFLTSLDNPYLGSLTGAILTLIIQSSSATVGMAIVFAKKGILSVSAGLALMIGAELGTCSDTLLATIGGSKQAKKAGLFHLFFNLCSIIIGLIFFEPFVNLAKYISNSNKFEHIIANGHVLFNLLGVLLFIGFVPKVEQLLNRWIKE
jgi:phosphate:Na+ symporter